MCAGYTKPAESKWFVFQVLCSEINRIHVFGANDKIFHIEFERPLFVNDIRPEHKAEEFDESLSTPKHYEWDLGGSKRCEELNLDYTSFNASWMKKEFIEKVRTEYFKFFLLYNLCVILGLL